ncbi:MAG: hypothetical protein EXX96DRAFT_590835 [Benjaminiella poitrasii]|nr:MAG: hypothetical protein EXX96DRAFT_590835 [Benjaminiella poitrasii]
MIACIAIVFSLNKSKAESIGSAKDEGISSPSRGSTSSHSAPVTEEEDGWLPPKQPTANEEYYYQTHPMQRPISATPTEEYYYPMQPKHQPVSATPTEECYYQAQPMHRPMTIPPASMMDPLYYQRLHLQQLQLQYQQQLYLMSQTPMFYAPAPLHPIMAAEPQSYHQPITMQQPMPPQPPPHQMSTTISKKHHSRRLTSTDLRRRAEMMRTSSETSLNRHSGEIAKSSRRQSYF